MNLVVIENEFRAVSALVTVSRCTGDNLI